MRGLPDERGRLERFSDERACIPPISPCGGGQLLSLVITLLIVPVAYAFFDEFQTRLRRRRPDAPADDETAPTAAAG